MELLISKDGSLIVRYLNINPQLTPILYMPKDEKGGHRVTGIFFALPDSWNDYRRFKYIGCSRDYHFYEEQ